MAFNAVEPAFDFCAKCSAKHFGSVAQDPETATRRLATRTSTAIAYWQVVGEIVTRSHATTRLAPQTIGGVATNFSARASVVTFALGVGMRRHRSASTTSCMGHPDRRGSQSPALRAHATRVRLRGVGSCAGTRSPTRSIHCRRLGPYGPQLACAELTDRAGSGYFKCGVHNDPRCLF